MRQAGDALQALVERGLERLRAVPTLAPLLQDPALAARLRQVIVASDLALDTFRRQPGLLQALAADDGARPAPAPFLPDDDPAAWPSTLLIDAGLSPLKAAAANLASVLTIFLGAFAGLLLGSAAEGFLQGLAPVAAGGFLYLALFVLLPALRRRSLRQGQAAGERVLPMAMGVGTMAMLEFAETRLGLDHGHVHGFETPPEARSLSGVNPGTTPFSVCRDTTAVLLQIGAASQHWRSTSRPRQGRQRQIHTMRQPVVGRGLVFF